LILTLAPHIASPPPEGTRVTMRRDLRYPDWYAYTLYSPQVGGAFGVARQLGNDWRNVVGPASLLTNNNCSKPDRLNYIPPPVAKAFQLPCAPL